MASRSTKVVVNQALARFTGYHLVQGAPSELPPQAVAFRRRAIRAEQALAKSRARVQVLEQQVKDLRARAALRGDLKPTWKLERRSPQS